MEEGKLYIDADLRNIHETLYARIAPTRCNLFTRLPVYVR